MRTYYIAVEEVVWDYSSQSLPSDRKKDTEYYKALYIEYTDDTYQEKTIRSKWEGNMGPILRAEVGDMIQIHFWNKANINCTMHPHGVFYEFEMEGAVFKGGYDHAIVSPGEKYTYEWMVHPRAGPGPADGHSVVWGYHSHVNENDIHVGLYGGIVIYRPGSLEYDEKVFSFFVHNENESLYLNRTLNESHNKEDNIFHAINGLIMASPDDLLIKTDSRWHLIGWGTFWDIQWIEWDDGHIVCNDKEVDQIRLLPASFYTVSLINSTVGIHTFGFLSQQEKGMIMYYNVTQ